MPHAILEEIRSNPSKNFKLVRLKAEKDNTLLKRILKATYCPLTKYGIKLDQIPAYSFSGDCRGIEWGLERLERIASREYTGNAAKTFLAETLSNLNEQNAKLILGVIDRSLSLGCNVSTINKAMGKNFIKEAPYQGAISFNQKKAEAMFKKYDKVFAQKKMDGRYANAILNNGSVEMESRQGLPTFFNGAFDNLSRIEELAGEPVVLNGELLLSGYEQDRYTGNGIVASLASIGEKIKSGESYDKDLVKIEKATGESYESLLGRLRMVVWDYIPLSVYLQADRYDEPYESRLEKVAQWIVQSEVENIELVESMEVATLEEAMAYFVKTVSEGDEGAIIKAASAHWQDGKPVHQQKLKLEMDVDLVITGANLGTGKNTDVYSSLNVTSSCGRLKTSPGGMSEATMQWVTESLDDLIGTVVKVKCSGLSQDREGNWSLYYPSVLEFRTDKGEADSLEDCLNIYNALVKPA